MASIIQKIGLRYQPNSLDALDDHRGKITLLISDVDGIIPPDLLERVCSAWALKSPYMPKASDLIEDARQVQIPKATSGRTWDDRVTEANVKCCRDDIHWVLNDDRQGMHLEFRSQRRSADDHRCTGEEASAIMKEFGLTSLFGKHSA